ncbi:peptidylprolyl isomerase [Candidatus Pacearchaeota archaeon]|nr:peptidylprolyl isomerase [Candidatus Pacearchaeota archaeon]
MELKKNDFVEVEFTAKVKNTNEIFDSNIKEDLKKSNLNIEPKPLIFSLGAGMFLKGIDDFLMGKGVGKYQIELKPEEAFGQRNSKLIQIIPSRIFREQNLKPIPGIMFNFDGRIAKILSVSGGRIIADFNNPIAGKTVVYDLNVLRKIDDINEKAKSFIDFLFRKDLKFEISGEKIVLNAEKNLVEFVNLFADKFKEILGLELFVEEENKEEKKEKEKTKNPN